MPKKATFQRFFPLTLVVILFAAPVVFAQQTVAPSPQTTTVQTPTPIVPVTYQPENIDPLQISIQGGGLWPSEKNDARLHDGGEVIGRLTYDLNPNLAIGAETGVLRFLDRSDGNTYGHLNGIPLMADLVLKIPIVATDNRLVPYIYGAAGPMVWHYDKSGYSDNSGVETRTRAHWAAKPGAGIEYYLNPHVAIFIEGSYLFSERFRLKDASSTPPNGKLDVDSTYGGGGIKIAF